MQGAGRTSSFFDLLAEKKNVSNPHSGLRNLLDSEKTRPKQLGVNVVPRHADTGGSNASPCAR